MGRKKMKTDEKVDMRIRLDADLMEQIKTVADEDGLAMAAWVRSLILKELKRRRREELD